MDFTTSKYSDNLASLDRINESFRILERLFIELCLEYANKISGTTGNETFLSFRDSVFRRFVAALFHYDLIANLNIHGEPIKYESNSKVPDGFYIALQANYLFDSIIFHVVSAFDYYAGLVKFISYGKLRKFKVTWGDMVAKSKHEESLISSQLLEEINRINVDFFKDLTAYRSSLIHNKAESLLFNQSIKLSEFETFVNLYPPVEFVNQFRKQLSSVEEPNLHEVSLWILESSINSIITLIRATSIYLEQNRRIAIEDEWIKMGWKENNVR